MFNQGFSTTTATLQLRKRRDTAGNTNNKDYGTANLPRVIINHLSWSAAKGLWDASEEDTIALNIPCLYHEHITTNKGQPLTHADLVKDCEITLPEGSPMAGKWLIDSLPACSADPDLGDILRLRRA